MKTTDLQKVAQMIDVSCVRTDVAHSEIDDMVEAARRYGFIAAFAMPCYTALLRERLPAGNGVLVGGVVGFPSGADTTRSKLAQLEEMLELGVDEIDMVINVGELRSGNATFVRGEIASIVRAADPLPVKCIIEACYLTDGEIRRASEIVAASGAAYVKTGTGWGPKPTTVQTVRTIKEVVGGSVKIKAAGGIRDLKTMLAMVEAGCSRFGIGVSSALRIMEEAQRT